MKHTYYSISLIFFLVFFACKQKESLYRVETTAGNITIRLYDKTPLHRDNFIQLIAENYYDSLLFHRIVPDFMIQTGNAETRHLSSGEIPSGSGEPGYTIAPEFVPGYYHKRGALAAARLEDDVNPEKRSSGSQFYIVQGKKYVSNELNEIEYEKGIRYTLSQRKDYFSIGGAPFLDGEYTVFGEVVEGLNVVDKIAAQAGNTKEFTGSDVRILRIVKI